MIILSLCYWIVYFKLQKCKIIVSEFEGNYISKCCDQQHKMWTEALILLVTTVIIISSEIEDEVKENITITASEDEVKKNITKRRLVFPDDELFHDDE